MSGRLRPLSEKSVGRLHRGIDSGMQSADSFLLVVDDRVTLARNLAAFLRLRDCQGLARFDARRQRLGLDPVFVA
jgi:hypothetical protein